MRDWIDLQLDWIDRHVAVFVIIGLISLSFLGWQLHQESGNAKTLAQRTETLVRRVNRDESTTKASAAHTRTVQVAGGPVAVCLLDVMRHVAPLLERVPSVENPLRAYVQLQSKRYPGVKCPLKHR